MNPALPASLASAIAQLLEGVSRKELAVRAETLSRAYRGGGTSRGVANEADVIAYLVARLPATYAAVSAVFARVKETMPAFAPKSLLDIGAGPGTASWAACEAWASLQGATLLDSNPNFLEIAERLASASQSAALSTASFAHGDLNAASRLAKADLVVASYVLAELPEDRAGKIAGDVWALAANTLVLVEPGTPAGFARILAARKTLLALGAHVAAPCTHEAACPMQAKNWCHFSQRLSRTRDHMIAKSANVPFEDERYSYLVVTREAPQRRAAFRIVAPPESAKAGITLEQCGADGLQRETIARREKDKFAVARRAEWGDVF
ncbi:MAG: SAM-dependent methyltransferase [Proteobacteria bacterium]|nr:SAM-dependent methyltransferase [Pseudomonadota bacterium]